MKELNTTYTDNDLNDFYKFIQMVFIKGGEFKDESFTGIEIYSQQLRSCFGKLYKRRILDELQDLGILRLVSKSYSQEQGYCKKYCLKPKVGLFYSKLQELVSKNEFTGFRSKKRIKKYLDDKYEDSLNYYTISLGDYRIHSPWTAVNRDWRHDYISKSGKFLVCDLDLKTAYWNMFTQFTYETLKLYNNADLSLEFNKLVFVIKSDIYNFFIKECSIEVTRSEMKKILNTILNSSSKDTRKYRGKYKKVYQVFRKQFPLLSMFMKEVNDTDKYMGYLFSIEYESKIIMGLIRELERHEEFKETDLLPIHDGVEFFQSQGLTKTQLEILEEVINNILKPYKYIKMEYKMF